MGFPEYSPPETSFEREVNLKGISFRATFKGPAGGSEGQPILRQHLPQAIRAFGSAIAKQEVVDREIPIMGMVYRMQIQHLKVPRMRMTKVVLKEADSGREVVCYLKAPVKQEASDA